MKWKAVSWKRIDTPAPTWAPLSLRSRELLVNCSWIRRKLLVSCANCSWCAETIRNLLVPLLREVHVTVWVGRYGHAATRTNSWTCLELFLKSTWAVHKLFVAVRESRGMVRTGTHLLALSRRVQEEFTNISRIVNDPVAKFCCYKNFEHFKILLSTWYALRTGLRTLHASLRLVCAVARLQSCQCVPQIRTSVSLA